MSGPPPTADVRDVPDVPDFRTIFDDCYEYVWASLRRLGVHHGDLDDLTDEVFLRVHAALTTYDRRRPLRPWVFAFAFRVASEYRRLARHRLELGLEDESSVDSGPTPEEALARKEAYAIVDLALEAISLTNRAVFVMYEIDGVEMREIARTLDIPLNTAHSRLRLARGVFEAKVRELRARDEMALQAGHAAPHATLVRAQVSRGVA